MPLNAPLNRKLRMGLVGGHGGFIGRVHALAARLDNRAVLVAGALSSDPEQARAAAPDFDIPPERAYPSYQEMAATEARLPPGERIDFVSIATPNDTHFEIAKTFAEAGFNVLCDKPLTFDLAQARKLARIVRQCGIVFAVTHNYTGYPLVRQARELVRRGELGEIHAVRVFYLQGMLRRQLVPGQKPRPAWKGDPARAGASGCFLNIGTHAYNLCRFITGLLPEQLSCTLKTFEPSGRLDDYGTAILRFQNGALGTLTASQISHGRENDLWIEVDGTTGALEWHQEEPNKLWFKENDLGHKLYTRNPDAPFTVPTAKASCRLPSGHPEGFLEAFANIYTAAFDDIVRRASGQTFDDSDSLYPNVGDGVDGMSFIEQCVASSKADGAWRSFRQVR